MYELVVVPSCRTLALPSHLATRQSQNLTGIDNACRSKLAPKQLIEDWNIQGFVNSCSAYCVEKQNH